MGFGRGIDTAARQGVEVMDPGATGHWRLATVTLSAATPRLVFDTPAHTPALVDLARMTSDTDRDAHAFRLVRQSEASRLAGVVQAERTVLGDARDLFAHVVRQRFSGRLPVEEAPAGGAPTPSSSDEVIVHLGETAFAREVLRAVRGWNPAWSGDPAHLDGDGYAILTVRAEGEGGPGGHILIVGGSEYGTAFGVAALLETSFQAAWIFPGDDGAVIPVRPDPVVLQYNAIEEPTVRSRSFAAMSSLSFFPREIDASRAWQLRNRMRPGEERVLLYKQRLQLATPPPPSELCGPPGAMHATPAFHAAMQEREERVPSNHVLARLLSPFEAPASEGAGMVGDADAQPRFRSRTSVYPDVRDRVVAAGVSEAFDAPRVGMVHPVLGVPPALTSFAATAVPCPTTSCCPEYVPFDPNRPTGVGDEPSRSLSSNPLHPLFQFCGTMSETVSGLHLLRFIPRAIRNHRERPLLPFPLWHPCIFEIDTSLPYGRSPAVRRALAEDLARQIHVALVGRRMRKRDPTHSIAFEDGETWCRCDACTRVDNASMQNGRLLFLRGQLIATQRNVKLECNQSALSGRPGTSRVADRVAPSGAPLMTATEWDTNAARNPFAGATLDELATRGVIFHQGYSLAYSLRVLSLTNAVCRRLYAVAERGHFMVDPDVPASPLVFPTDWVPYDGDTVLSIFAYVNYAAPPLQSPTLTVDPNERCHNYLLPFMTGVRDTAEYAPTAPLEGLGALERLRRAPDQFNQERWSAAGARRIGLYEYPFTHSFAGPNLYSARMRTALVRGERFRVRAFVAETMPAWGLSGATFWEWSRLLWKPSETLATIRQDYCARAFGPAAANMQRYLDVCEAACASTRDGAVAYPRAGVSQSIPDVRTDGGRSATWMGRGYAGRSQYLSQLDGWYRPSEGDTMGRNRLLHAWSLLEAARRDAAAAADAGAVRRVNLVRRSFGFTLLIALWYQPLREAFELLRERLPGDGNVSILGRLQVPVTLLGKDETLASTAPTPTLDEALGHYVRNRTAVAMPTAVAGVVPRDDFARARRMTTTAAPPVDMSTSATLRAVLRQRIGTRLASGIRALRNDVHQYLALSGLRAFDSLGAGGLPAGSDDLGFGFFASSGWTPPPMPMSFVPFPTTGPTGPHRMVGLYLHDVNAYINWWNGVVMNDGAERRVEVQRVLVREDAPGIGWIFNEIKAMAAVILLYSSGVAEDAADFESMKLAVLEG